jgi:hypothetical protein
MITKNPRREEFDSSLLPRHTEGRVCKPPMLIQVILAAAAPTNMVSFQFEEGTAFRVDIQLGKLPLEARE